MTEGRSLLATLEESPAIFVDVPPVQFPQGADGRHC